MIRCAIGILPDRTDPAGVYAHGDAHPWLLEPVAGMNRLRARRPRWPPAAKPPRRRACILATLHFVGRYYPSPGGIAQVLTSYVGIADLPDGGHGGGWP